MPLRNRVNLGFGGAFVVLLFFGIFSYYYSSHISELWDWVGHTNHVLLELKNTLTDMQSAENGVQRYLQTGDQERLEQYHRSQQAMWGRVAVLKQLLQDNPRQQAALDEMEPLLEARFENLRRKADLLDDSGNRHQPAPAMIELQTAGGKLMDEIKTAITKLESEELALLRARDTASRRAWNIAGAMALIASVAGICIVLASAIITNRQILYRNAVEAELRQQNRISEAILQGLSDGVVVADTTGKFTVFNPAAEKMLGQGPSPEPSFKWQEHYGVFHPDKVTPMQTDDLPLIRCIKGENVDDDVQFIRSKGRPDGAFLSVSARPLRGDDGSILGGVVAIRDITEKLQADEATRQLNAELARRNLELATANADLESFSYSVSHDLRTPVRSMISFSRILLEDHGTQLGEEGRKFAGRIVAAAERMGKLIDGLLELSRLTRQQLQREQVDLSKMAQEIAAQLQQEEPQRQVDFNIAGGANAEGDTNLLYALMSNLFANAWKFTLKRPDARIEFGKMLLEGQAVYFVKDNGAGFDMKYSEKLFGAFQRLHSETEFKGTGVGLATVQRIIRRHGGKIWADAKPEQGATFYFTLKNNSKEAAV